MKKIKSFKAERFGCPGTYRGLRSYSKNLRTAPRTVLPHSEWSSSGPAARLLYRAQAGVPLAVIYSPFIPLGRAAAGGAGAAPPAGPVLAAILLGVGEVGWRGGTPGAVSPRWGGPGAAR